MSAGPRSTEAAKTGMVQETNTGTKRETGVRMVTGGTVIGLPPGTTEVTNLAGTGMNVITGHPETGRGHETTLEIDIGRILEVKKLSRGLGRKSFCPDLLHPGLSSKFCAPLSYCAASCCYMRIGQWLIGIQSNAAVLFVHACQHHATNRLVALSMFLCATGHHCKLCWAAV